MDWKELGKRGLKESWEVTKKGANAANDGLKKYNEFSRGKNEQKITDNKEKRIQQKENDIAINKAGFFDRGVKCPKCSSKNVEFMQNDRKAFSTGKAVGGAVLTGGIGTLAGFTGKKGKNEWHCTNCGKVFKK